MLQSARLIYRPLQMFVSEAGAALCTALKVPICSVQLGSHRHRQGCSHKQALTCQQVHEGGLASAVGAHNGHPGPHVYTNVEVLQQHECTLTPVTQRQRKAQPGRCRTSHYFRSLRAAGWQQSTETSWGAFVGMAA